MSVEKSALVPCASTGSARTGLLLPLLAALVATPALAQQGPAASGAKDGAKDSSSKPEMPVRSYIRSKPEIPQKIEAREGILVSPAQRIDANDVLQEMLDEFAADIARLGASNVSPILIDRIRVSDNVNPEFAAVLEARLVSALQKAAKVAVVKCVECNATQSRVQDGVWIVSRGVTTRDEQRALAEAYRAQVILNVAFTLYTRPDSIALDVQMVRGEDSSIAFAESYRVHPHTAQLYRSADRAQEREARLKDLEARINDRPIFSHAFVGGAGVIPYAGPDGSIWASHVQYRFMENFGVEREWRLGFALGGMFNPGKLLAGTIGAQAHVRVTPRNVYMPTCLAGGGAGGFIAGLGNSTTLRVTAHGECVFAHRIAGYVSLSYIVPFQLGANGYMAGGLNPEAGLAVVW